MKIEEFLQGAKVHRFHYRLILRLSGLVFCGFWVGFFWLVFCFRGFFFCFGFFFPTAVNCVPPTRNRKKQEEMQTSQCWTSRVDEIKKLILSQHCSSVEVIRGIMRVGYERRASYCHF